MSLSLGGTGVFGLRAKDVTKKECTGVSLQCAVILFQGDSLLMSGRCQEVLDHRILSPKDTHSFAQQEEHLERLAEELPFAQQRMNFTLRRVVNHYPGICLLGSRDESSVAVSDMSSSCADREVTARPCAVAFQQRAS